MKRKTIIAVTVLIFLTLIIAACIINRHDPNFYLRKTAAEISEGEEREVSFVVDQELWLGNRRIPVLLFTPEESAEYDFTITDISTSSECIMTLNVVDSDFSGRLSISGPETYEDDNSDMPGYMADTVFLTGGREFFIIIDAVLPEEAEGKASGDAAAGFQAEDQPVLGPANSSTMLSGTFKLTITKAPEVTAPPEISAGSSVQLAVSRKEQSCAVLRPEESGYYIFDSQIAADTASEGFSVISAVTVQGSRVPVDSVTNDGVYYLETGKTYYVWTGIEEARRIRTDVSLSCTQIAASSFDDNGCVISDEPCMIEYHAEESEMLVIYSESAGDPLASVYDKRGFPLRTDDNSGGSLTGNDKDFALVITTEKGQDYRILVSGELRDCVIRIALYTGDGTSLENEDVEIPERYLADTDADTGHAPDAENEQ